MKFLFLLFCISTVYVQQIYSDINCTINFDLTYETDDERYLDFMNELDKLTFSLAENCPDPNAIDQLVWEYRFDLYEMFKDSIVLCQCEDSEADFIECMGNIRDSMRLDVTEKYTELSALYCSNDDALDEDIF